MVLRPDDIVACPFGTGCGFMKRSQYRHHLSNAHGWDTSNIPDQDRLNFACGFCWDSCVSMQALQRHVITKHINTLDKAGLPNLSPSSQITQRRAQQALVEAVRKAKQLTQAAQSPLVASPSFQQSMVQQLVSVPAHQSAQSIPAQAQQSTVPSVQARGVGLGVSIASTSTFQTASGFSADQKAAINEMVRRHLNRKRTCSSTSSSESCDKDCCNATSKKRRHYRRRK